MSHHGFLFLNLDDLADLEKQLTEGGASVHDLEKAKKKLQQELEEINLMMEVGVVYRYHGYIDYVCRRTKANWK